MPIFQKSPEKTRDAAAANVARLSARLTESEDNVIRAKKAAQRAAIEGDDAGLDGAERAEGAAMTRLTTITAAHSEAEKVLAALDGQIAATLDQSTRAATAAETNALADDLIQAGAGFDIAIAVLADVSARAALISFEATGVAAFATSSRVEVPAAIDVIVPLLRDYAKSVLSGMAAATLPRPDAPMASVKPIAPAATRVLFSMKAVKWTTADGNLRYAPKYAQVDLPLAVADHALAINACVTMDSTACRMFHGTHVAGSGNPDDNVSLDDAGHTGAAPASTNEPVQFERVDRGPSFQLRVAGGAS